MKGNGTIGSSGRHAGAATIRSGGRGTVIIDSGGRAAIYVGSGGRHGGGTFGSGS